MNKMKILNKKIKIRVNNSSNNMKILMKMIQTNNMIVMMKIKLI